MAFLGRPDFILESVTRAPSAKTGMVTYSFAISLFAEALELCLAKLCDDVAEEPMWEITAEVWGSDAGEFFRGRDDLRFSVPLTDFGTNFLRVTGAQMLSQGQLVSGSRKRVLTLTGTRHMPEGWFNEDSPGTDELYMRVYLSSVFTSWQVIQTIDSRIQTGDFRGTPG